MNVSSRFQLSNVSSNGDGKDGSGYVMVTPDKGDEIAKSRLEVGQ